MLDLSHTEDKQSLIFLPDGSQFSAAYINSKRRGIDSSCVRQVTSPDDIAVFPGYNRGDDQSLPESLERLSELLLYCCAKSGGRVQRIIRVGADLRLSNYWFQAPGHSLRIRGT